jgi:hypothetical protein
LETPNPTPAEILEAMPLLGGRISLALKEVERRLRLNLPGAIDAFNAAQGYPAGKGVLKPAVEDIVISPANVTNHPLNCVLISISADTATEGARVFRKECEVLVFSIEGKLSQAKDSVADVFDRAGLIQGSLYYFLTHCRDAQNREAWAKLEPGEIMFLPEPFEQYAGAMCSFRAVLTNDEFSNHWT